MSRFIYGYNPKNDLFGYKTRRTDDVNVLFSDLARNVVTGVSIFSDQEMTNVITGETWISNSYRNNANIKERGNIALIDFEGTKENNRKIKPLCQGELSLLQKVFATEKGLGNCWSRRAEENGRLFWWKLRAT